MAFNLIFSGVFAPIPEQKHPFEKRFSKDIKKKRK